MQRVATHPILCLIGLVLWFLGLACHALLISSRLCAEYSFRVAFVYLLVS